MASQQAMLSPHSRRLRTIGMILLIAVTTMALYGAFVLMPKLRHARTETQTRLGVSRLPNAPMASLTPPQRQLRKFVKAQLLLSYAYWSVCGILIIALLVVAWLDFREVMRNYLILQAKLIAESAREKEAARKLLPPE